MNSELIFGGVLVASLLGLAGFYAWRQMKTLRALRDPGFLSADDRLYVRKQVYRRLLSSMLMVALAAMLAGWFLLQDQLQPVPLTVYVIVLLLDLFTIIFLAAIDLVATARFGLRQQRQLEAERRAVLESEVARLRQQRNGHARP